MSDNRECLFCREPAEVALDDHHIVPKSLVNTEEEKQIDITGETQVLCSNCHRKFHSLLDPALEYVTARMRERIEDAANEVKFEKASNNF